VRLAHDAQNRKTIYSRVQVEPGERVNAFEVYVSTLGERGKGDGADAG
jgi:hypothetical protein